MTAKKCCSAFSPIVALCVLIGSCGGEFVVSKPYQTPVSPGNLKASVVEAVVELEWADRSSLESEYLVQRSTSRWYASDTTIEWRCPEDSDSTRDEGNLDYGTKYYYRVCGLNELGRSDWEEVSIVYVYGSAIDLVLIWPEGDRKLMSVGEHFEIVVGDVAVVELAGPHESASWYLDGTELSDHEGSSRLEIDSATLEVGEHRLSVVFDTEGTRYSETTIINITQDRP